MRKEIEDARWPHTCRVYRIAEDSFSDDKTEEVAYEGRCYAYGSTNLRTFRSDNVTKNDYAVDIPTLLKGVKTGFVIDFTNDNGTWTECEITECSPVRYGRRVGTTIFTNTSKN